MAENSLERLRQERKSRNQTEKTALAAPPPLPKSASELYSDALPPDVPVVDGQPQQVAENARPNTPTPLKPKKRAPQNAGDLTDEDMPNRVEARVSEAELAVIRQVVRKEKGRRSKTSGEPSGFNRQDLVREGLLAMCRMLEPDFDDKVKKMTAVLKEVE